MDFPGPPAASPRATVARLPLGPGVYRFRDAGGRVLYVGGVLVRFEVRAGRLSGWTQRACAAPGPAPANPGPAWTDFARRTAELAALLRRCPG